MHLSFLLLLLMTSPNCKIVFFASTIVTFFNTKSSNRPQPIRWSVTYKRGVVSYCSPFGCTASKQRDKQRSMAFLSVGLPDLWSGTKKVGTTQGGNVTSSLPMLQRCVLFRSQASRLKRRSKISSPAQWGRFATLSETYSFRRSANWRSHKGTKKTPLSPPQIYRNPPSFLRIEANMVQNKITEVTGFHRSFKVSLFLLFLLKWIRLLACIDLAAFVVVGPHSHWHTYIHLLKISTADLPDPFGWCKICVHDPNVTCMSSSWTCDMSHSSLAHAFSFVFSLGFRIIWRLCTSRYFSVSSAVFPTSQLSVCFPPWEIMTAGTETYHSKAPTLLTFCLQGQNPFESDDFTKNGSHLMDSFNFDSSPRHGECRGTRNCDMTL